MPYKVKRQGKKRKKGSNPNKATTVSSCPLLLDFSCLPCFSREWRKWGKLSGIFAQPREPVAQEEGVKQNKINWEIKIMWWTANLSNAMLKTDKIHVRERAGNMARYVESHWMCMYCAPNLWHLISLTTMSYIGFAVKRHHEIQIIKITIHYSTLQLLKACKDCLLWILLS